MILISPAIQRSLLEAESLVSPEFEQCSLTAQMNEYVNNPQRTSPGFVNQLGRNRQTNFETVRFTGSQDFTVTALDRVRPNLKSRVNLIPV